MKSNQIYFIYFIPMDEKCNPELLEERKFERGELPLESCKECLFNVLCADYLIYEEWKSDKKD